MSSTWPALQRTTDQGTYTHRHCLLQENILSQGDKLPQTPTGPRPMPPSCRATHAGILISLQQIGNSCRNTSSCAAHVCTGASYGVSKTSSTEQQCNTQKQAHAQVDSTTHVTFLHSAAGVPPPLHTESIQALSARTLCGLPAHTWYTNIIQSGLSLECVHVQHQPHYGAKTANPVPIPLDQSRLTS